MIHTTLRTLTLAASVVLAAPFTFAQNTASQDMKDAGHSTKNAAVSTGHATKKAAHSTANGTKKVVHKTGDVAEDAGHDTKVGAKKTGHALHNFGRKVEGKPPVPPS